MFAAEIGKEHCFTKYLQLCPFSALKPLLLPLCTPLSQSFHSLHRQHRVRFMALIARIR